MFLKEVTVNYFSEANRLYNTKEYEEAIKLYQKAVEYKENEACSYYNSGVCFIKLKNYDCAINMLKKAITFQMDSKYFFNLGYCYAMKQNNKKALIYFNISWALDNKDKDCEKAINLILSKYKKD
ncbi:tetratricopeptide repeat protein [Clostridium moniliforme]|uniref:tetratricopeptide repeat protein n=1 Tax=Clostridium moniliforme TaxID=39489 RepID=UPI002E19A60F